MKTLSSIARRRACVVAVLSAIVALPAAAQGKYPEKPITFVVPFAAGSATDQLARALGASITADTKQAVVVDNKAGASGMLAAQAAARAPADGYTVLITTNTTHAANEHLRRHATAAAVRAHLGDLVRGDVVRHELPTLGAFNFVITHALGGGVTRSLAIDAHGKSLSSALLELEIPDPDDGAAPMR